MIEGIRGTGVIEFHNVPKTRAFACSGGIGLKLCLLETKVFAHLVRERAGWERVEWGIGR